MLEYSQECPLDQDDIKTLLAIVQKILEYYNSSGAVQEVKAINGETHCVLLCGQAARDLKIIRHPSEGN